MGGTTLRPGAYFGRRRGSFGVDSGGDLLGRLLKSILRLFPERQILVRAEGRVSYIMLSRRAQVAMALAGVAATALVAYGLIELQHRRADQAAGSGVALQGQVDDLQRQLAAANARLTQSGNAAAILESKAAVDEAQARIKALEEARDHAVADEAELQRQLAQAQDAASNRTQSVAQLNHTLDANRGELRQSDSQRQALQARVHQLETELEGANARTSQAKADLASNERKLQQLAAEHDKTLSERDRLQARLTELQGRGSASDACGAGNG